MCSSSATPELLWLLLAGSAWAQTGEVRGTVVDARGGEALANVAIQLIGGEYRATTDSAGRFHIAAIVSGDYTLNVSTVGYRLEKKAFHLDPGETKEFEVILSPDTLRHSDSVVVQANPFETVRQDSPASLTLAGTDAKNLASVLADDPLRAVQSLPGVSSNNDFDARFSLRGAAYNRIGLYLDDVLLHAPFQTVQGQTGAQGSITAFNGDLVEEMELHQGAWPQRFTNRSAGVLDVHTRDGSRTGTSFRITAGMANAGGLVEGPLGKSKRGSWLVGARKSYLQYIFDRVAPSTSYFFAFQDAQGKLSYNLTARHKVTLFALESFSSLDRTRRTNLGVNALAEAGYHYTLGNLGWRYASQKVLLSARGAWMRERYENRNPTDRPLGQGYYGEWVGIANATWMWSARAPLDFSFIARRPRESGSSLRYQTTVANPRVLDTYDGAALQTGGSAQQSWSGLSGMLHLSAGARWDRHSLTGQTTASPHVSAALYVTKSTRLQLGWGQYVQFPEISLLTSPLGGLYLLPIRSHQTVAGIEQRLGERTRLRLEFYDRVDRDLPWQPLLDPRLLPNGQIFNPPVNPPYTNSLRGYSRGLEIFLQRSSANRFTGWVSYAFGRTRMREGVTGDRFVSDYDQRHTVNVYTGYRIRPSINLSGRWSYGSGFPVPAYLTNVGTTFFLSTSRNVLRMPYYSRADVRVNKSWTKDKWKFTLYGEVVNLTNRDNYLFDSFNGYNTRTGQANLSLDTMFPILPSAGFVFER